MKKIWRNSDMSYKKIVFTKPKVAEIQDYEITEPNADEVQVRLAVSSISSTIFLRLSISILLL